MVYLDDQPGERATWAEIHVLVEDLSPALSGLAAGETPRTFVALGSGTSGCEKHRRERRRIERNETTAETDRPS
jgi:hypothetical protein